MSNLKDLLAQKAALDRQIEETRRRERADAIGRIKALMAEYGLTMADLQPASPGKSAKGAKPARSAKAVKAPKAGSGRKVAPKFRDAASGATWSGRGLQPRWLREALAAGRKLEEFKL